MSGYFALSFHCPFFIDLYFLHYFFNQGQLIDLNSEILIFFVKCILFLLGFRRFAGAAVYFLLINFNIVDNKLSPSIILIGDIEQFGCFL